MKFLLICSSFSGEHLTQDTWNKIENLAYERYTDIDGIIIAKEEYTVQGLTTYDFNNKDNINFAFYWLLKNLDMKDYDAVMLIDVKYLSDLSTIGKMLDLLLEGKNIVHVQKKHSPLYNFFSYGLLKFSNTMNKMLLGTKESNYIKNFVAFDKSIIELLQEFPHKCGFVKETAYLINANTEIIFVEPKYPKAKMEKFNPTGYIFSGLEAILAFTCFMLAIWLPLSLSNILWLIILMILFGIISVLHFSISNINRIVKLSKLKESPNILSAKQDTISTSDKKSESLKETECTTTKTNETIKVKPSTTTKSKNLSTKNKTSITKSSQKKSTKKDGIKNEKSTNRN